MVTLKEIAAEAGVSVMTVSNVIHNNLARVSPETAARVQKIIEKHHYVPNMAARSLISKASHIIALLLPLWYETADSMLLDPYAGQMVGMLETLLREKNYYVMICSFKTVSQVLSVLHTWQIDGSVLILPHEDAITHELAVKSTTPLVIIDRHFTDIPSLSVCVDDQKGGYLSTRHLLEQGHRRIGFAGPFVKDSTVIRDRYEGYCKALAEYGIQPRDEWHFDGYFHQTGGEQIGEQLLCMADRPTAIVSTEDLIACGIIKRLQAAGLEVPQDLSVIGFDNSLPARLISPGLTTVAQDIRYKAECVVRMLMDAISDETIRDRHDLIDVALVTRESVAAVG